MWTIHRIDRKNEVGPAIAFVKRLLVQHPYLFHAYAATAASFVVENASTAAHRRAANLVWLEQQNLCVTGMQEALKEQPYNPPDELLLAACAVSLVVGNISTDIIDVDRTSPCSPVDLTYFNGNVSTVAPLYKYLRFLIQRKGGIQYIRHAVMYVTHSRAWNTANCAKTTNH